MGPKLVGIPDPRPAKAPVPEFFFFFLNTRLLVRCLPKDFRFYPTNYFKHITQSPWAFHFLKRLLLQCSVLTLTHQLASPVHSINHACLDQVSSLSRTASYKTPSKATKGQTHFRPSVLLRSLVTLSEMRNRRCLELPEAFTNLNNDSILLTRVPRVWCLGATLPLGTRTWSQPAAGSCSLLGRFSSNRP